MCNCNKIDKTMAVWVLLEMFSSLIDLKWADRVVFALCKFVYDAMTVIRIHYKIEKTNQAWQTIEWLSTVERLCF